MLYGVWVARLVVIWCLSGCGLVFGCLLFFFGWFLPCYGVCGGGW